MTQRLVCSPLVMLVIAIALLVAACDSDEETEPTPTPPGTATATATASPPPTATPEATMTPPPWTTGATLIQVASGTATELYTGESYPFTGGFQDDGSIWLGISGENRSLHFDPDGTLIEEIEGHHDSTRYRCHPLEGDEPRAEIDGEEHPVNCGIFSPDGQRMFYTVDLPESEWPQGAEAAWLLDLNTGEATLLTDELRHCGGCDGRAAPAWSPSGRYVLYVETYQDDDSAVFLTDTQTGDTSRFVEGLRVVEASGAPQWSPVEDALLAPAEDGWTRFVRLDDGSSSVPIEIAWPARFDDTGTFAYSYAVLGDPYPLAEETTIARVSDGEIVASWPGRPQFIWPDPQGVTAVNSEPAALLEGCYEFRDECSADEVCAGGTVVYHPALAEAHCLHETLGAEWSPGHTQIAGARQAGDGVTYPPPLSDTWELVLYDVATGAERVLATDIQAPGGEPPRLFWNPEGTHILIQWPRPSGI